MEDKLKLLAKSFGEERFRFSEKLIFHTFSKSKGLAQCFFIATSQSELIQILDLCNELSIPTFIIGSGTKIVINSQIPGLTIKNRTSYIKVTGVKGKISKEKLGIEEAFVEADGGVSLNKLNEFLKKEKLQEVKGYSSLQSTVGGAIFLDPLIREIVQSLKVWEAGEVMAIKIDELKRNDQVVLSVIFKFKAKS